MRVHARMGVFFEGTFCRLLGDGRAGARAHHSFRLMRTPSLKTDCLGVVKGGSVPRS